MSQVWGQNATGAQTPTLQTWRETTGLPWFAFWIRELLKWGTLDPFVAFCLAQGTEGARIEATARHQEFDAWLAFSLPQVTAEDLIDPRNYLEWQRSLTVPPEVTGDIRTSVANLTGSDGRRASYDVLPMRQSDTVNWIDAAGFTVARSDFNPVLLTEHPERHDFTLSRRTAFEVHRSF